VARWECIVCGLVYDEAEGWPDDGIPPGTKWEDVPEDWLCPDCGVGKADFECIDSTPTTAASVTETTEQASPAPSLAASSEITPALESKQDGPWAKWECIVCGLIYDEAEGWPDDGIPPGTKWEDVPEDWLCPDCGVGKDDFELLSDGAELAPAAEPLESNDKPGIVVLGTGMAAYGLVREFRKSDTQTKVTLVTFDDGANYSKPLLSTGFTKSLTAEKLAMQSAGDMANMLNASVITHATATRIDTSAKQVLFDDGATLAYDKLVLAVGSEVIRPPLEGDAHERIFSVNDLQDYAAFRVAIEQYQVKKVCIIGGGLIGCEFTNDLLNGGFQVEAVDPLAYCLPTLLPPTAGLSVQGALEDLGAKFHFGRLVKAVNKTDSGVVAVLDDGSTIEADIVVSAVGVRPRTQLAVSSGIEIGRGVVTDRYLATSAADVYALGDCAEVAGHVLFYVAPLVAAGKALAKTLAGEPTPVVYPAMPVAIKTPACPCIVSPPPRGAEGQWTELGQAPNIQAEFRAPNGDLLGFALTGSAIKEKMALQKQLPPILD
jgi:rubredoxin-NAD+ reductase